MYIHSIEFGMVKLALHQSKYTPSNIPQRNCQYLSIFCLKNLIFSLDITIVRRSIDEFENDSQSYQIFTDISPPTSCSASQDLQSIITSPGMRRFCIQLQLGHRSNDQFIIYPKSTVKSEIIVDGKNSFNHTHTPLYF